MIYPAWLSVARIFWLFSPWLWSDPSLLCDAWNNVTFAGDEVKNAEKTIARSLVIGTALVGLLYVLAMSCI